MNPSQEPTPTPYQPADGTDPAYPPPYSFGPGVAWEPVRPRRRPWRRNVAVAALTTLVVAVGGVALGVLWHYLAPGVPVIDTGTNGIVVNDPSPEEYIASDGWFTLIGFAYGLVVAVAAWLVVRRDRGPGLLVGVTIGALAAAPLAWQLGRQIGLDAYEKWRDTATAGATYQAPPDLHAHGALLVPAFAAVIVTTLLAGWSNDPDLERPGAKPGYGRDLTTEPGFTPDYPQPPDGSGPPYGAQSPPPYGARPPDGSGLAYGSQSPDDGMPPYGSRPPDGSTPPYGAQSSGGSTPPYGARPSGGSGSG